MKAIFVPALTALAGLAGLAAANPSKGSPDTAFKAGDAVRCDTPDADDVPADNDCMDVAEDIIGDKGNDFLDVEAGGWRRLGCSEKCAISVWREEGSEFVYGNIRQDVNWVVKVCGFEEDKSKVPFKGELARGGRTTSVFKGDC